MKKFFTILLLAAALLLCCTASAQETAALPAVGGASHGFTVSELGRVESLGADVVKLTHDRTGARVIFVLNDDTNLGFSICFHTEPSDDTGMLHILEHAVCAASEKYPGRDVFFDAISQAYLTGLNAWTSLSSTNYYATSMDENQLEVLADFYLDCAFHSALLTEPNYFYREGWRYEMPAPEDDLTVNGIVYNEMQGSYGSIFRAATANLKKALFPDTYQSRDSGGIPAVIPDLSYDQLIAFYKSCYNPANSVTMFYGNVDMDRFLAFLNDGYFSVVEPGEKAPVSPGQAAFDAPVYVTADFPVSEGSEDTGAFLFYATALTETDSADYLNYAVCDIATTLLADNSSALMQALNASGIGSSYGVYVDNVGTQLTLNFYAMDADAGRDAEFKEIVLTRVAEMAKEGFSQELLRSLFASMELSLRLQRNRGDVAISLFDNLTWIQEMGNDAPLNAAQWYQKADELCVPGYAEDKLLNWVVNNPHGALVSTIPVPGLLEKNEQALRDKLAETKADMSEAEKQAVVEETAAFSEWVQLDTPVETLEKVSVVNPATVDAAWAQREIATEEADGVTVLTAPSSMDMTAIEILLDVGHLTDGELRRLNMLSLLLGSSTEGHSQEEITASMARLMNSLGGYVTRLQFSDGYRPVYALSWYAPNESVQESVALAFELLQATDIAANADLLAQSIDSAISSYRDPETVNSFIDYVATASMSGCSGFLNNLRGLPSLDEMNAAKAEYAADPEAFVQSFAALREKAFQRQGALVMIAGDEEGIARTAILAQLDKLPESCGAALLRNDLTAAKSTAIIGSTQASYISRGVVLENPSESVTGDKLVLCQLLRGEYLLPELRFQMGAYNANLSLSMNGYWMAQYYRGGAVFDADAVILGMPEYIEGIDITQKELDAYKLPAISNLLTPSGELNDTVNEMYSSLYGFTQEKRLALVEEIRNTTVADIKALAPVMKDMLDHSGLAIITSATELAGREGAFDAVEQMP